MRILIAALALCACAPALQDGSELKVVGGDALQEADVPGAVRITFGNGACTATFVSANTMLTAAHCATQGYVRFGGVRSKQMIVHPSYASGGGGAYDLAIALFDGNVAPATVELASAAPQVGSGVEFIGYGVNDIYTRQGSGTKRRGRNTVSALADGMIWFAGQSIDGQAVAAGAGAAYGDSGGPMLAGGKQVGVASFITDIDDGNAAEHRTAYVDLASGSSRQFLASAVAQGAVIPGIGGTPNQPQTPPQVQPPQVQPPSKPQGGACKCEAYSQAGNFCGYRKGGTRIGAETYGPFADASMNGFTCGDAGVNDLCKRLAKPSGC